MAEPKLLLMDEPFSGVSPSAVQILEEQLRQLSQSGLTLLIVEHDLEVLERLCDTIVVMARGRILLQGTMNEIRSDEGVREAYLL